jgi:4-amino-4-deoxy-L-arabinose transferase-like glycosyltransferase
MGKDESFGGEPLEGRERWILVALCGLAFLLRLWLLRSVPVIETDGVQYVEIARRFQQSGSPFDSLFHPLYPMAIAAMQPLAGDYELAGRLVSALFGTAVLLPAFILARALLGSPAAILTGILMAIHPGLLQSSTAVLSEASYTFWIVLGVWAGWRALAGWRPGFLVAAGLCFGLAYLTRPEGVIYLTGLLVLTAWVGVRSHRLRELSAWGAAALGGFLILAAPYLVFLRRAQGYWTLSGKVLHNLIQDTGVGGAAGQTDLGFLLRHGSATVQRVLENAYLFEKYALPDLFPGLLVLALLPGLMAHPRGPGWGARQGLLLAAALPPFATLAFHVESRVFLPTLPFLLPVAAAGVLAAAEWIAPERRSGRWVIALATVLVAALIPYTVRPLLRPDPGGTLVRQAAHWVATTHPPEVIILDRKPFIAFYSGRRFAILPRVAPDELASVAGRAGARLVILDSRALVDRPELFPLVYGEPPAGLEVLQDFDAGPAGRLRILGVHTRG